MKKTKLLVSKLLIAAMVMNLTVPAYAAVDGTDDSTVYETEDVVDAAEEEDSEESNESMDAADEIESDLTENETDGSEEGEEEESGEAEEEGSGEEESDRLDGEDTAEPSESEADQGDAEGQDGETEVETETEAETGTGVGTDGAPAESESTPAATESASTGNGGASIVGSNSVSLLTTVAECTCETKCTDSTSNEECPLCIEDYSACTAEAVATGITIITHPTKQTGLVGDYVTFTVEAESENDLSYQWLYKSTEDDAEFTEVEEDGTESSLTVEITAENIGYKYKCKITDDQGNYEISESAKLVGTTGWDTDDNGQWIYYKNGVQQYDKWISETNNNVTTYYYVDTEGYMVTGLYNVRNEGTLYYFDEENNGAMAVSTEVTVDGVVYVIDENGAATVKGASVISITTQPEKQFGIPGDEITFIVEAEGIASYQWMQAVSDTANWEVMEYETSNELTVTVSEDNWDYTYICYMEGTDETYAYSDSVKVSKTGWKSDSIGFMYYKDGVQVVSDWAETKKNGETVKCYIGNDGYMVTGLQTIDGTLYYFDPDWGDLLINGTVTVDGVVYTTDENGVATAATGSLSGWVETDDGYQTYYINGEKAVNEILLIEDNYYGFDENGYMLTKVWMYDEDAEGWRWFNSSGHAIARANFELKEIAGKQYAFNGDGIMLTGWVSSSTNTNADWKEADYYFIPKDEDGKDDGSAAEGFVNIEVVDEEETVTYLFYFETGKKVFSQTMTIDGVEYIFNEYGVASSDVAFEIVSQPHKVFSLAGTEVSFSVSATGVTSYQWMVQTSDDAEWADLEDGTESILYVPVTEENQDYKYKCVLKNALGEELETNVVYVTDTGWDDTDPENLKYYRDGQQVFDELVYTNGTYAYLNEDGIAVTETWMYDEEADGWRWFDLSGLAMFDEEFTLREIDGKQYAFSSDALMLVGWVSSETNANADWKTADYYFLPEEDENGKPDGSPANGLIDIKVVDGEETVTYTFYFESYKKFVDGAFSIEDVDYVANEYGVVEEDVVLLNGWVDTDEGRMYYLDGVAVKDEIIKDENNGELYYLDTDGYMVYDTVIKVDGVLYEVAPGGELTEAKALTAEVELQEAADTDEIVLVGDFNGGAGDITYKWQFMAEGTDEWVDLEYDSLEVTIPVSKETAGTYRLIVSGELEQYAESNAVVVSAESQEGFKTIDGELYYFDENGEKLIGWQTIEGNTYYFDPTEGDTQGRAYRSDSFLLQEIDGISYAFDADGIMLTGWVSSKTNAKTEGQEGWKDADYYFAEADSTDGEGNVEVVKGQVTYGWKELTVYGGWKGADTENDYWFFFRSATSGKPGKKQAAILKMIGGQYYYFDETGAMWADMENVTITYEDDDVEKTYENCSIKASGVVTSYSLKEVDGEYYYYDNLFETNVTGWHKIDGDWYFFALEANDDYELGQAYRSDEFALQKVQGTTYAFNAKGVMLKGWVSSADNAKTSDWKNADYYFEKKQTSDVMEGAAAEGLKEIEVVDGEETVTYTFYFEKGKKITSQTITVNEGVYVLNEYGVAEIVTLEITKQPESVSKELGDVAEFAVEATGAVSYQWEYSTDGTSWLRLYDGEAFSGVTTTTLTVSVTSEFIRGLQYRCVVTAADGTTETSEAALIQVPDFGITSQPESVEKELGETAEFTVEATGAVSYQWEYSTDGTSWLRLYDGGVFNGVTTTTLTVSVTSEFIRGLQYRCVVTATDGTTENSNVVGIE